MRKVPKVGKIDFGIWASTALTVRFHETLFFSSWWLGRTLEHTQPGKTHALAVAAFRRQPCRLPLSCARTDYADKYAVSIRSILTLPNSYLFQLTDLFCFLGRCLLCILSLFSLSSTYLHLPPTGENTRQLNYTVLRYYTLYNN